jgi:tetratricopeptide (TPR) repeat protein
VSGRRAVLLGLLLVAAIAAGVWYVRRPAPVPVPDPPEVATAGVDPEVAEAVRKARQHVLDQPRSAEAWGELGKVLFAHDFDRPAGDCFAVAGRLDPADARWPYYQGLYALGGEPDTALTLLRRAVAARHPDDAHESAARLRLAEALLEQKQAAEAERLFREEQERDPGSARAAYGLGLVALERDDLDAATGPMAEAARTPFARCKASAQLARIARRRGDAEAAARYEQDATRPPPDAGWPDPYVADYTRLRAGQGRALQRAESLERRGQLPEAVRLLFDMLREYPNERTYLALGASLVQLGDFPQAEQMLAACLRLDPENAQAHHFLAVAQFLQGERLSSQPDGRERAIPLFREAAEHGRRAVERKPDFAVAYAFRGRALDRLGQRDEAIATLRKAVECRPEVADSHLFLGEVLAETGRRDEARAELKTAEQLAGPDDPRPRQALERLSRPGN